MIKPFIFLLFISTSALAQWQVPDGSIPLGKGAGKVGFGAVTGSGGAGAKCLLDTTPPSFGSCISAGSLSLTTNRIFVGSAGNIATGVPMSGDCTIISSGAITCTKTSGTSFGYFATGADASNLTGTVVTGRGGFGTDISASTGIPAFNSGSVAFRTLTGTANEITVSNGTGASASPIFSLPTALTFTGKTVTGGTFSSGIFTGGAFNGTLGATTPSTAKATTLDLTAAADQFHVSASGADNGGYLSSVAASQLEASGGAKNDGVNWIAKATSAAILDLANGTFNVYGDTGLTPGSSFTPTLRLNIQPALIQAFGPILLGAGGGALQSGNTGINGTSGCLTSDGATPANITAGACGTGLPGGGTVGDVVYNTAAGTGNWFRPPAYSVAVNAATDCTGAVATVLSTVIGTNKNILIPPNCTLKISADDTIAKGVTIFMPNGALISVDNTKTLTVHGVVKAGPYKIFTGSGTVTSIADVLPEWWDARNDGSTDDILALRAAWTSSFASSASDGAPKITLSPGSCYKVSAQWTIAPTFTSAPEIAGAGSNKSRICAAVGFASTAILQIDGQTADGITELINLNIHDFGITTLNGTATGTTAICLSMGTVNKQIQGTNNSRIYGMFFDGCTEGIHLGNVRIITFSDFIINLPNINNAIGLRFEPRDTTLFTSDMQFRDFQITTSTTATGQFNIYYHATNGTTGIAGIAMNTGVLYMPDGAGGVGVKIVCDNANVADLFHYGKMQHDGAGAPVAAVDISNIGTGECYDIHLTDNYFQGITGNGVQIAAATPDDIYDIIITNSFFRGITKESFAATNTNNVVYANNVHTGGPTLPTTQFIYLGATYGTAVGNNVANSPSATTYFVNGNGTATNTGCTNNRAISAATNFSGNMGGANNDCAGGGAFANRP